MRGMLYNNAIMYVFEVTSLCAHVVTYYRYCERDVIPTMIGIDESTQGTIEEQMLYNRKTLREIIELRYADVKRKVSL